mgnify:CR=1 FL=1|jgi:hypothetical protein
MGGRPCSGGCGQSAGKLECPKCQMCVVASFRSFFHLSDGQLFLDTSSADRRCYHRLGVSGSFFCSQPCFAKNCESGERAYRPESLFWSLARRKGDKLTHAPLCRSETSQKDAWYHAKVELYFSGRQ